MVIDENRNPFGSLDSFNVEVCRPTAFAGGTTNARGDSDGTNASYKLFSVEGDVAVRLYGVCTTDLAGSSATLEVGVTGNTACLIAQSTATDIDSADIWISATVTDVGAKALASIPATVVITNGLDIYEKTATADITAGNIYYVCLWRPVTPGATVEATSTTRV